MIHMDPRQDCNAVGATYLSFFAPIPLPEVTTTNLPSFGCAPELSLVPLASGAGASLALVIILASYILVRVKAFFQVLVPFAALGREGQRKLDGCWVGQEVESRVKKKTTGQPSANKLKLQHTGMSVTRGSYLASPTRFLVDVGTAVCKLIWGEAHCHVCIPATTSTVACQALNVIDSVSARQGLKIWLWTALVCLQNKLALALTIAFFLLQKRDPKSKRGAKAAESHPKAC